MSIRLRMILLYSMILDLALMLLGFDPGFSIARCLTEAQQGALKMHSEGGKESAFTIRVPVTASRADYYNSPA
jgi:hypothetical protein